MVSLCSFPLPEQEWDVVTIGGGAAGTFAAVAAASAGAKTLLVERNGALGGTITAAGLVLCLGKTNYRRPLLAVHPPHRRVGRSNASPYSISTKTPLR